MGTEDKMQVKSFGQYVVEADKDITFVFGRFNPPTTGHEKLFDTLKKVSRGGTYRVYASKSQDPKKNPLGFKEKVKFLRKMFPKHARNIMADGDVRHVMDIAVKLYDQGFTRMTMVAGSDRIKEFEILLNKYNGKEARHGFYQFENKIKVISAGERDPDSDDVSGMSASKLRAAASDNDLELFSKGMPKGFNSIELFNSVRKGMGLKESNHFRKHVELPKVSETREEYIDGTLFKEGDEVKLKETREVGTIINRGANYLTVRFESGKKKVWLEDVCEVGTDKTTSKYKKGTPGQTEDSNYYTGLSKSTADKRKAHFNKGADMDDNNPKAYKKAPGDATAKTKPSKHTKKYQQMFGELKFEDFNIDEGKADDALAKKADKSGMPLAILRKVFDRGFAAWRTGHRPGTNPTQWGLARVNSFVTKSPGTWGKADKDLAAKV